MIITLTGANDHQRKRELANCVADFVANYGDMAVERFDGEDTAAPRMREALQSLPFLSERKLVVLREPAKQKAFSEDIAAILEELSDSTDLILYEPKLDKRSSYYKTLKKVTDFRDFTELDALALAKWATEYVAGKGGELTQRDATQLIVRIGTSQQLLQSELDKLLAYQPHITASTIELLTEPTPQSTVFELLDAAFAGKTERAFTLYKEQRALKIEPQAIIAMLAWQLHILAVVKAAGTRGVDEIAATAKLNPFVVRKSQALTRHLSLAHIKKLITDLLQFDMQLKSSALDADEALQYYLLKLS